MSRRILGLLAPATLWPAVLTAQLGEIHLGVVASYGTNSSQQAGAGLIAGVAAGRLVYVGARWVYFGGSTTQRSDPAGTYDVTTRTQMFAADVGLQYPAGKVELVAGVTIGATRYGQETDPAPAPSNASSTATVATEFLFAPGFSAQFRALGLLFIPEVAYDLGGSPDLRWPAANQGLVFGVRIVVPIEVDRIRY